MVWQNAFDKFKELFGEEGEIGVYFAPGRVNLIGEHTDYNGGHVFPCALTIGTYGVARKRKDKKLRFYSMNFEQKGIIESSLEDLALIGQYSENKFNGVNCGIMDQFAIAMGKAGHAIFLDTATLEYEYAPIQLENAKIIIACSNKKRGLGDSKYNERRKECETALAEIQTVKDIQSLGELTEEEFEAVKDNIESDIRMKRAKHAVYENQRTQKAVQALQNQDIALFGELMNASHISLRDDYEVTGLELDTLVEEAWKVEGVIGSRMTGAGFGGCTVSIVKDEAVDVFIAQVGKAYESKIGYPADFYVVEIGGGPQVCTG